MNKEKEEVEGMRAVLMAAGVGSRISREVRKPKSLLDIGNGELLLHYTVKMLKRHGLDVDHRGGLPEGAVL